MRLLSALLTSTVWLGCLLGLRTSGRALHVSATPALSLVHSTFQYIPYRHTCSNTLHAPVWQCYVQASPPFRPGLAFLLPNWLLQLSASWCNAVFTQRWLFSGKGPVPCISSTMDTAPMISVGFLWICELSPFCGSPQTGSLGGEHVFLLYFKTPCKSVPSD